MSFIKVTCVYEEGEKAEYFVNVAQIHSFESYDCQSFGTIITFADGTSLRVEENPNEILDMIKRGEA